MEHEDLMQQTILNAEGYLFVVDNRHPKFPTAIARVDTLNPEYVNLLTGSLLLYRTAQEAKSYIESLIEYLETKGLDEAVPSVSAIQATLDSAMKISLLGWKKGVD